MSESLQPHGLQHARLQYPSLSSGVCLNSHPLSWWWHLTISSPASLFSFCLQSLPASEFFPVNRLFLSGGRSIGASASASVLLMSIQGWFPLGLTGFIPLLSKGLLRVFSSTTVWKHQLFSTQPWCKFSHPCESESLSVVSDSLWPHGLYSPWNSPGQNTGVGSLSLVQGIFPTQELNRGLPHCRQILYQLSEPPEKPKNTGMVRLFLL